MVQGLAFLSKKSWHTKNLNNQEKVWIAEEQAKKEQLKMKELAQQMQQEREEEELQQIAGGTDKKLDRGIDWMYTGHDKNSALAKEDAVKQAEEFLLGKAIPMAATGKGDIDAASNIQEGVNAVVKTSNPPEAWPEEDEPDSVAQRNEAFRLRMEDPMYQVSLQTVRHEKRRAHEKELYEKVGLLPTIAAEESIAPMQHLERSDRHSRKHARSDDESSRHSSSEQKRHHRSHRRKGRETKRRYDSSDDEHRNKHSHKKRSSDVSSRKRHRNDDSSGRRGDHYEASLSRERITDDWRHSSRDRDHDDRYSQRDRDHYRPSDRDRSDRAGAEGGYDRLHRPDRSYGLQRNGSGATNAAEASHTRHNDLGPDPEMRRNKRQEKHLERQSIREHASQRRYQSAEDRARALRAMEDHGKTREVGRWHTEHSVVEPSSSLDDRAAGGPRFVREFAQQVHGISSSDARHSRESMSARLQQNRNSQQRIQDNSFL